MRGLSWLICSPPHWKDAAPDYKLGQGRKIEAHRVSPAGKSNDQTTVQTNQQIFMGNP